MSYLLPPTTPRAKTLRELQRKSTGLGLGKLSAAKFVNVWYKYDRNRDGAIGEGELDLLITDLMQKADLDINEKSTREYRKALLDVFDKDKSGTIDITELAEILPVADNYLVNFQSKHKLTSRQFLELFHNYDLDHDGFIDAKELRGFVWDLLTQEAKAKAKEGVKEGGAAPEVKVTPQDVEEKTTAILAIFDENGDGKIDMDELSKILPVEESFLVRFKGQRDMSPEQYSHVFAHYDTDGDGVLEGTEVKSFLMDLLKLESATKVTMDDLDTYYQVVLELQPSGRIDLKTFKQLLKS